MRLAKAWAQTSSFLNGDNRSVPVKKYAPFVLWSQRALRTVPNQNPSTGYGEVFSMSVAPQKLQ